MQISTSWFEKHTSSILTVTIDGREYAKRSLPSYEVRRAELYNRDYLNELETEQINNALKEYYRERGY
jgi:hypothetical protein